MPPKRTAAKRPKRFSVTLDAPEYEALRTIAEGHRPPLSLRYVVEFALRRFLKDAENASFRRKLGDPRGADRRE